MRQEPIPGHPAHAPVVNVSPPVQSRWPAWGTAAVIAVLWLLTVLLILARSASAQTAIGTPPPATTGQVNLTNGTCATEGVNATGCVSLNTAGYASVGIGVTGTWSGTLTFKGSTDGTTFTAVQTTQCAPQNNSTTSNGLWTCSVAGFTKVEVIFTNYVSGTAVVTINSAFSGGGPGGGGGGGGGGTSSNFGSAFPTAGTAVGFKDSGGVNMAGGNLDSSGRLIVDCGAGCASAADQTSSSQSISAGSGNLQTFPNGPTPYGLALAGENGAAFTVAGGGSLIATLTPQCSTDGGTTYPVNGYFVDPVSGVVTTTQAVSSPSQTVFQVLCPQGSSHASLKATAFTSGTSAFTGRSTVVKSVAGLVTGAVSTSAPTYTTGQTFPISLDTSGNLRTLSGQSGTWTVQPGNTANTTPWLVTPYQGAANLFPNAAALADNLGNPTTTGLGSYTLGWDSTNSVWRRVQVATTGKLVLDSSTSITANAGTGNFGVIGSLTHNNAAPSGNNLGVLPALANTGAPAYTNGDQVLLSTDTAGNLRSIAQQSGAWNVSIIQGGNTAQVNSSSQLSVNCANCSGSGVSQVDNTGFTFGTTNFVPNGGVYNSAITPLTSGNAGAVALTPMRSMHVSLFDVFGNSISSLPISGNVSFAVPQSFQLVDRLNTYLDPRSIRNLTPYDTPLMYGTVTTAPPSYTTGTNNAVSIDTAGNIRINCVAGCSGGNGGTALTDNGATFTQGTTQETPVSGLAESSIDNSYTSATAGRSTIWQMTLKGHGVMDLSSVGGTNVALGQTTMAASLPVTVASNQSNLPTNITQFGGTNLSTGTGASGTGIPRVTISNDSSLAANQSVNVAQVAGTTTSVNVGASDAGTTRVQLANDTDPCRSQANTKSFVSINQTGNTQLLGLAGSNKKYYICSIQVVTATAQNIALVDSTTAGNACATSPAGVDGFGGSTAATGWNFAANGGVAYGQGGFAIGSSHDTNAALCLLQSGSGQVSGGIGYVAQ